MSRAAHSRLRRKAINGGFLAYNDWIAQRLGLERVQKLSIDAGFSCPNRDGTLAVGGCSFCANKAFTPPYCDSRKSVSLQLQEGKDFFRHKYPSQRYLAYFQSFSGTYFASPDNHSRSVSLNLPRLRQIYEEALSVPDVVGLVIGTRPDCVSDELLDYLQSLQHKGYFIEIEYGVESTHDATLSLINRRHTYQASVQAVNATKQRAIPTCVHLILGLPGESCDDMLAMADDMNTLHPDILKLHQLQIVKGTPLADQYAAHPFPLFSAEQYVQLVVAFLRRLDPSICVERFVSQVPDQYLIAPKWGLKNFEFTELVKKALRNP